MPLPARTLIVILLFIGAWVTQRVLVSAQGPKKEVGASVSGKVTVKGKPAPGVVVAMHLAQPNDSSPTYRATTNEDGVYHINNVANGNYRIAPLAPAMVVRDEGDPDAAVLVISGGDSVDGLNFDMAPGGVITGKVIDSEGRPVIAVEVSLTRVEEPNQPTTYYPLPENTADDRGVYRIFGIPPGRYKVVVGAFGGSVNAGRPPVPLTYYPDAREASKGGTVDIDEGGVASNIDIRIGAPLRMFTVSGRVIESENGKPVPSVIVRLARVIVMDGNTTRSFSNSDSDVRTDREGQFKAANVASGRYELSIYKGQASDFRPQGPTIVEVSDSDVTDVAVKTVRGGLVSGVLVFEGNSNDLAARTYVIVYVKEATGGMASNSTRIQADGSFSVGGLTAGTLSFTVAAGGQDSGTKLVRLERDGVVQPNGISISATEHITGLRLFVAYSSGAISGVVKVINGTLPPNTRLSVEARRADDTTPNMGFGQRAVDARGRFLFEGLTAGTYQLTVSGYVPNSGIQVPATKQLVTVTDGAVSEITLTIDLALSPKP
jgi:5-hydroxyisourate hydrolase-like protein (transthyretin family)